MAGCVAFLFVCWLIADSKTASGSTLAPCHTRAFPYAILTAFLLSGTGISLYLAGILVPQAFHTCLL